MVDVVTGPLTALIARLTNAGVYCMYTTGNTRLAAQLCTRCEFSRYNRHGGIRNTFCATLQSTAQLLASLEQYNVGVVVCLRSQPLVAVVNQCQSPSVTSLTGHVCDGITHLASITH